MYDSDDKDAGETATTTVRCKHIIIATGHAPIEHAIAQGGRHSDDNVEMQTHKDTHRTCNRSMNFLSGGAVAVAMLHANDRPQISTEMLSADEV